MIKGHGIDLEELSSIERAYSKNSRFAQKVLTPKEFSRFEELKGKRKMEYLAGRWSAKEAFSKAWGTGIGKVTFQDLEILNNQQGAPYFSQSPFDGKVWVSISHAGNQVIASVILEEENES
ncbi:holo-ACP synthase [Streptococcus sinensis]|uniref:Holo-[acyl-carrier-protein] synthase n=1 Tax=Streptococcus sinensis TaxID=176090 RepID=A0A0A0DI00_9STRE|nr:holo-ACP synthase [Streptococcus sinensis]KGM37503.1 Holo-[acyl-carrier protein] synthase [Streptococcus sinensis]